MEMLIRELQPEDVGQCFLDSLSSLAEVGLTVEEAQAILTERRGAGIRTFVARTPEQVVGTASLFVEHKFIHHGGRVGYIEDVSVHRNFKGHGIGSALVQHLTGQARRLGCYKVLLSCGEGLVPFYKELGFRPHGVTMRMDF